MWINHQGTLPVWDDTPNKAHRVYYEKKTFRIGHTLPYKIIWASTSVVAVINRDVSWTTRYDSCSGCQLSNYLGFPCLWKALLRGAHFPVSPLVQRGRAPEKPTATPGASKNQSPSTAPVPMAVPKAVGVSFTPFFADFLYLVRVMKSNSASRLLIVN